MKHGSTLFLRLSILAIGAGVALLCIFALPELWSEVEGNVPAEFRYVVYMVIAGMYVAAIPYYVGLYNAWRLLGLIDQNKAFSHESVKLLKVIAICAATISAVYAVVFPFFYMWGDRADAPGLIVIGMVMVGMPLVVSVCAALLRRLLKQAVDMKSENELTV